VDDSVLTFRAELANRCRLVLLAFGCSFAFSWPTNSLAADRPLPTYLLIGQSNMTGADSVATPQVPGASPLDREVLFWNRSFWNGKTWEDDSQFQPLRAQSTAGYCADVIGPEFGFSRALNQNQSQSELAIIKVSMPASDLDVDWRAAPSGGKACYAALAEEMGQATAALKAKGLRPDVRAILIHQGISDATSTDKAMRYEANLRRLIDRLRKDFASPSTMIVITRSNLSPMMSPDAMQMVRAATVQVGESMASVGWINVDDLDRVVGHHFTAAAQMEIGERFARKLLELQATPNSPRTPREIAFRLLDYYGDKFDGNSYIHALSLMGRLQAAKQYGRPDWQLAVQNLLKPYVDETTQPQTQSSAQRAGHLVFAAAFTDAEPADQQRYLQLLQQAAERLLLQPAEKSHLTLAIKPPAANEMSDAVFMCCPLLCAVGALSGDARYFQAALDVAEAMHKLCLRDDGIYRHWSGCDAAWGRGNGFPIIGIARCLELIPEDAAQRSHFLKAYRDHIDALLSFQDVDGAWRQVIDDPQSYPEMTSTCMIGWAIEKGLQAGWLEGAAYEQASAAAWHYVRSHIGAEGQIGGACEGTGQQPTVEAYLKRKAIHARDDRGGAMALLFALQRDAAK